RRRQRRRGNARSGSSMASSRDRPPAVAAALRPRRRPGGRRVDPAGADLGGGRGAGAGRRRNARPDPPHRGGADGPREPRRGASDGAADPSIDWGMASEVPDQFAPLGFTYDVVLLLPGHSDLIPAYIVAGNRLTREIYIR